MTINRNELLLAVKEHMLGGNPITHLESSVLFGVPGFTQLISRMRKEGWIIKSRRVPIAKAIKRINAYATLNPPKNLPVKEILITEYWISR